MRNKLICLALSLSLLLTLCVSPAAAAESGEAPSVRVLLRRLALTDRADLSLTGAYTASWGGDSRMLLPAGCGITVQIRSGRLVLFYREAALDCGAKLTLRRVAAEDAGSGNGSLPTHGLRVAPGDTLYPGDLTLTVSGGQLQPVLTVNTEDYLLGVVPYEMSDSFPLEALKAQAVCARTYALSRVDPKKEWDVVDTTNDQVYRGLTGAHPLSDRAVRETAGLVGVSGGRLASCYYSASNGGQTELPAHVWSGAESASCFAMTDDPYDLENPNSIIRKAVLRKDGTGLPETLLSRIRETVFGQKQMDGFAREENCFRVDAVTAIKLTDPRFEAPSRLMTKMEITVSVSGRIWLAPETPDPLTWEPDDGGTADGGKAEEEENGAELPRNTAEAPADTALPLPAETPAMTLSDFRPAGSFTVSLNLFPYLIRELGLTVYGADNEIVTVSEEEDRFILSAGRYGHGVGLSQRGAEWMAGHYGKTFREILDFYYPGMSVRQTESGDAGLPTPDPILAETPGPAATPTPRPTLMPISDDTLKSLPEGAWLASVENIEDDSTLNLRAEPSPAAEVLMRLYKHQKLIVLETCWDPSWVHVKTDSAEGYVMVSFLKKI